MPDYTNAKIYTIRCRTDKNLIYVGSTTQTLSQRWTDHIKNCNYNNGKAYNRPIYKSMREVGQDQFYIDLFEDYPCERKEQLNKKEGEIIREMGTLNKNIAGRTRQQHYQDNCDKLKCCTKQYTETNRDKLKEILPYITIYNHK